MTIGQFILKYRRAVRALRVDILVGPGCSLRADYRDMCYCPITLTEYVRTGVRCSLSAYYLASDSMGLNRDDAIKIVSAADDMIGDSRERLRIRKLLIKASKLT